MSNIIKDVWHFSNHFCRIYNATIEIIIFKSNVLTMFIKTQKYLRYKKYRYCRFRKVVNLSKFILPMIIFDYKNRGKQYDIYSIDINRQ